MIQVGSRVVCVDDRFAMQILDFARALPRQGRIYTVQAIVQARHCLTLDFGSALRLCELHNPLPGGAHFSFAIWRFREHVEKALAVNELAILRYTNRSLATERPFSYLLE
jgi:hypothetical protein